MLLECVVVLCRVSDVVVLWVPSTHWLWKVVVDVVTGNASVFQDNVVLSPTCVLVSESSTFASGGACVVGCLANSRRIWT